MKEIENVELTFLTLQDYDDIRQTMAAAYDLLRDAYWEKSEIKALINKFPEGQIAIKVNGQIVGCAFAIIVDYDKYDNKHTYKEITGDYTFKTHDPQGNILYGIDVFIKPEFRGLRLGRRLYNYRKEICENLNLKGIAFGGRIPKYHEYAKTLSPKQYIDKVRSKEIHDPVLNFQLSNDFHPTKIIKGYLEGDEGSEEYAVLLEWDNISYEKEKTEPTLAKKIIKLGLVQWQMRPYQNLEEVMQQAEFFIDSVSGYRCDFALFPEFFNAPLMAINNHLPEHQAIRELAKYTPTIQKKFSELAIAYNINIITGSMPDLVDEDLYNVGHLCKRDGSVEKYEKLHVTPDELKVWGLKGGEQLKTFDTDCGKIGILICYDVEFPELTRLLADEEMDILFVPFLTDTQNGYSRVRACAQARAIENECYVAIAGSVGNLPKVENMSIQFAQSGVFTPCDFAFPTNGVKAETTPNTEMILIADVDIGLLREIHNFGSVRTLNDRRSDLFKVIKNPQEGIKKNTRRRS